MARVVQRRGTPPYLLILFVGLFVLSAALAVVFYVQSDDHAKQVTDLTGKLADANKKAADLEHGKMPGLLKAITGRDSSDTAAAEAEAEEAYTLEHANASKGTGLVATVRDLHQKIKDQEALVKQRDNDISQLKTSAQKKDDALADSEKKLQGEIAALNQKIQTIEAGVAGQIKAKDDQLQRSIDEQKAIIDEKAKQNSVMAEQLAGKNMEIQRLEARIKEKDSEIKRDRPPVGELVLQQADGKIAKTLLERDIVYINRGEKDGIVVGLPFSVYPAQTGVTKEGTGKAKISVISVGPTTSECRVTESKREDPIVEGDIVANLVFNTTRTHNFVVEGDFDLYGDGVADPAGNERIRKLIESFGGRLVDHVGVTTDFVVMGEMPIQPDKPADDAPAGDWTRHNEKMQKYHHYVEVQAAAQTLQIPILNTTRFLAFSGFVPKKRLIE